MSYLEYEVLARHRPGRVVLCAFSLARFVREAPGARVDVGSGDGIYLAYPHVNSGLPRPLTYSNPYFSINLLSRGLDTPRIWAVRAL